MKLFLIAIVFTVLVSCSTDKELQLAEIQHSEIKEILDVSPAYIFYNTKAEDSVELNKQNLISTTNWLVNVDKRLTLKQIIPVLIHLQEKKRNASHKKEGVKNYFTAFNPEVKSLRFIEFTNVNYLVDQSVEAYVKTSDVHPQVLTFNLKGVHYQNKYYTVEDLVEILKSKSDQRHVFVLNFEKELSFQTYMHIKDLLLTITNASVLINTNEFIF
ncbi:hypothetical protein FNB79_01130 [Formosa sediminum]|uniref:Uncharacterized protein n=1 Tax=Formosa sediminum TaxID=2594004 RepID=A0A516GM88_9FLAO|nr:hypothetical protein [Formosa sediminum]QDO92642.1 hypothetical protein FNB79_01130 [Formosa sediminum]